MQKLNIKVDALKKTISRFVKNAPSKLPEPVDPVTRIVRAFLEYDCDDARASVAERKVFEAMVDTNELRVTPAIELAALLGVRFPFAESRCSALHRTLQSIFDREHQMRLERLNEMKKTEIRPYFQSLAGITPYVEAAVCVDCFGIAAAPVDTKLLLWLISKDILPEDIDLKTAQTFIEKNLKATEAADFFHGSRKELEGWSPKAWPQVARAYSPILAPPSETNPIDRGEADRGPSKAKAPEPKHEPKPEPKPAKKK